MLKNTHRWILPYINQKIKRLIKPLSYEGPLHIMFAICDHFEPDWGGADESLQIDRVKRWVEKYPLLVKGHKGFDGQHPKHSFFYPAEVYDQKQCNLLERLTRNGFGEVEIHLHHKDDTEDTLKDQLNKAKSNFIQHGFLSQRALSKQTRFAFIHGNWSLNNSRSDGKWCGVNNESHVLAETGCYADFTYPSAPSETQPSKINSLYYSNSHSDKPKSHNKGIDAEVGKFVKADLLLIQGPLALNWRQRRKGFFPRIENGDLSGSNPPTEERVNLWVNQHIHVKGKPNWIFIKLHTHGAPEKNAHTLLGEKMHRMYDYLSHQYNDGKRYCLHYVTAREMYNIIKAAEAGEKGDPHLYRDYLLTQNSMV